MRRTGLILFIFLIFNLCAIHAVAQTAISTEGVIESKSGGFRFPDGSTQTVATPIDDLVLITDQSRTIAIPGDYASLTGAFAALQGEHIIPGTTVTLQIDAGTYINVEPLEPNHPDGISIKILGDPATPSNVVLSFVDSSGLILTNTHLMLIDGVVISGDQIEAPYDKIGIQAGAGASINLGNNVIVEGFDVGLQAESGGFIKAEQTTSRNNTLHGFVADSGGVIHASSASATDNGGDGFLASNNGTIIADMSVADGNSGSGFVAHTNSNISAQSGDSIDNGAWGYDVWGLSIIDATTATASGNTDGSYSVTLNVLSSSGGLVMQ